MQGQERIKKTRSEKGTTREKNRCEEVNVEGGNDVPSIPCLHYYSTFRVVARRTTAVGRQFRVAPTSPSGALQGRGRPKRRPGQSTTRRITMEVAGPCSVEETEEDEDDIGSFARPGRPKGCRVCSSSGSLTCSVPGL